MSPPSSSRWDKAWICWPLMLLQAIGLFLAYQQSGFLDEELVVMKDTVTYEELDLSSFEAMLTSSRTLVFPIFVQVVHGISPDYSILPYVHFWLYAGSAAFFAWGLACFLRSGWRGAVVASGLLYATNFYARYHTYVAPEVLGASLATTTMGMLLWVLGRSRSLPAWTALAASLALTYHCRPAYLFLVPLIPVVGIAIRLLLPDPSQEESTLSTWRLSRNLVLCAVLPLLLWSSLRFVAVGHFGLVSFGGLNTIGIAGQWLDDETIEALPEHLQPVARRTVERREVVVGWKKPKNYQAMLDMYNDTIWRMSAPAAFSLHDGDWVEVNQSLSEISIAVFKRYPLRYARWVYTTFNVSVRDMLHFLITDRIVQWIILVLGPLHLLWLLLARGLTPEQWAQRGSPLRRPTFNVVILVAGGFAIAKVLLVALVEPGARRYILAAGILLPMIISAGFVTVIDSLWGLYRLRRVAS